MIRPTRLLDLTVLDPSPERAQLIATTFVKEFDSFLAEQKRTEARNSELGLRAQADGAYARALESEKQLEEFRGSNPEFTVEQDHQLFAERLSKMGEEQNLATGTLLSLQSRFETLETLDPQSDPIEVIETGGFSELKQVADVVALQTAARTSFAEASSKYTTSNPDYLQALAKKEDAEAQVCRTGDRTETVGRVFARIRPAQ